MEKRQKLKWYAARPQIALDTVNRCGEIAVAWQRETVGWFRAFLATDGALPIVRMAWLIAANIAVFLEKDVRSVQVRPTGRARRLRANKVWRQALVRKRAHVS